MTDASVIVTIANEQGLHAKPAMVFGARAAKFTSKITVTRIDTQETIDGKSLLGMLSLALAEGTDIRIDADGEDAQKAVDTLERLVQAKFGEG